MIILYTDGGCRRNGKPDSLGGWGMCYQDPAGSWCDCSGAEYGATNNTMELTAALKAVEVALELAAPLVEIRADSQYVIKGITEWVHSWRRKGWRKGGDEPIMNLALWQALLAATERCAQQRIQLRWTWVRGHAGHFGNERADKLATNAMDQLDARKSQAKPARHPPYTGLIPEYKALARALPAGRSIQVAGVPGMVLAPSGDGQGVFVQLVDPTSGQLARSATLVARDAITFEAGGTSLEQDAAFDI